MRETVELRGIGDLVGAIKGLKDTSKNMNESSHRRNLEILQTKQIEIQEQQVKMIKNQTFFTKILTIATVILGLGVFLDLILRIPVELVPSVNNLLTLPTKAVFLFGFFVLFSILAFLVFFVLVSIFSPSNDPFDSYKTVGRWMKKHWKIVLIVLIVGFLVVSSVKWEYIWKALSLEDIRRIL